MSTLIVTRHAGAVEWLRRRGFSGEVIASLDESGLPERADVVGVLPLSLAVALLERDCRVYLIQFPARQGPRGSELSVDEMESRGAKLYRFGLKLFSSWGGAETWLDGARYNHPDDDASWFGGVRLALEEV